MHHDRPLWPRTHIGLVGLLVGVLALSLWIVFPMVTMRYREIYPVTDSWVMPATSSIVTMMAALVNGYAVVVHKERSWLNMAITMLVGVMSLVALTVMIGGMVFASSV